MKRPPWAGGSLRVGDAVVHLLSQAMENDPIEHDPRVAHVIKAGADLGVTVEPRRFAEGTRTAGEAAAQAGCDIAQIVKTLIFIGDDRPMLFFVSGRNRLSPSKGAKAAGVTALVKADASQAKGATGYSIGATPPFGLATEMDRFMDEDLMAFDEVWAAGGRVDSVFPVSPEVLARVTNAAVCNLKED